MAEALAALTAERPLVLLLEDLHWSDASTLDLIAAIARRTEPAQLLVIGTYRPVEVLAGAIGCAHSSRSSSCTVIATNCGSSCSAGRSRRLSGSALCQ